MVNTAHGWASAHARAGETDGLRGRFDPVTCTLFNLGNQIRMSCPQFQGHLSKERIMKSEIIMPTETRCQFTDAFTSEAVRLTRKSGRPGTQVAWELGIFDTVLSRGGSRILMRFGAVLFSSLNPLRSPKPYNPAVNSYSCPYPPPDYSRRTAKRAPGCEARGEPTRLTT